MTTLTALRSNLEDAIDILTSDYTSDQWAAKNEINLGRYHAAKSVYSSVKRAIDLDEIDWCDDSDEDYEAINELMDNLGRKLKIMEEGEY